MRRDRAATVETSLEGDADGKQHAIPDDKQHRSGARVTRRKSDVACDEHEKGGSENHEIPAGKQKASRRGGWAHSRHRA
jgi:hypothetical protein